MEEIKKLVLIIDGPTEEGSFRAKFNKLYNCSPSFRQGPGNGVDYKVEGYINGVMPTVIHLLSCDTRMIILLPDLEKRKVSTSDFSTQIKAGLISELIKYTKFKQEDLENSIYVCPPNIMFENWIISDVEGIKVKEKLIKKSAEQAEFDGKNGTGVLQKMMIPKYKKTVHGKELFKATRDDESVENSPSYKEFMTVIDNYIKEHCS